MVLYTIELDVRRENDYFYRFTNHSTGEIRESDSFYLILKGMAKDAGYYLRTRLEAKKENGA